MRVCVCVYVYMCVCTHMYVCEYICMCADFIECDGQVVFVWFFLYGFSCDLVVFTFQQINYTKLSKCFISPSAFGYIFSHFQDETYLLLTANGLLYVCIKYYRMFYFQNTVSILCPCSLVDIMKCCLFVFY